MRQSEDSSLENVDQEFKKMQITPLRKAIHKKKHTAQSSLARGRTVKCLSNSEDTSETGKFYGIVLKKGPFRSKNFSRV